jgi:hypothetical protein
MRSKTGRSSPSNSRRGFTFESGLHGRLALLTEQATFVAKSTDAASAARSEPPGGFAASALVVIASDRSAAASAHGCRARRLGDREPHTGRLRLIQDRYWGTGAARVHPDRQPGVVLEAERAAEQRCLNGACPLGRCRGLVSRTPPSERRRGSVRARPNVGRRSGVRGWWRCVQRDGARLRVQGDRGPRDPAIASHAASALASDTDPACGKTWSDCGVRTASTWK